MKKNLFFIAFAIVFLQTSCSEVDCDHFTEGGSSISYSEIAGTWYEPGENEEVKFTESGRYYDKFSNHMRAAYIEGNYEISGNKLTYRYDWDGQSHQIDNTISDIVDGISFKITSATTGAVTLYKVTETINIDVNGEATLPTYNLKSPDERLLSIDGLKAKSNGMKGTLYLQNSNDTYVKVVIGTEINDLWYDYTSLIGATATKMKELFGTPSETEDNIAYYNNMRHDIIEYIAFIFVDGIINEVQLNMKEGVLRADVEAYLSAKYFMSQTDNVKIYYSHENYIESLFFGSFSDNGKAIVFAKRPPYIFDFSVLFKYSLPAISSTDMFKNEEILSSSEDSVRYTLNCMTDLDYVTFYFKGKGKLMNSFAVHHTSDYTKDEIDAVISESYTYFQNQEVNGNQGMIYMNDRGTRTVIYYPELQRIEYYDLTQEEEPVYSWPSYTSLLNGSKDKVIATLGEPYMDSDVYLVYVTGSNIFNGLYFHYNVNNIVDQYFFGIKEDVDMEGIKEHLNSEYTFLKHDDIKNETLWINANDISSATVGIQLYANEKKLYYFYIGS